MLWKLCLRRPAKAKHSKRASSITPSSKLFPCCQFLQELSGVDQGALADEAAGFEQFLQPLQVDGGLVEKPGYRATGAVAMILAILIAWSTLRVQTFSALKGRPSFLFPAPATRRGCSACPGGDSLVRNPLGGIRRRTPFGRLCPRNRPSRGGPSGKRPGCPARRKPLVVGHPCLILSSTWSFAALLPISSLPKVGLIHRLPTLRVVLRSGVAVQFPGPPRSSSA